MGQDIVLCVNQEKNLLLIFLALALMQDRYGTMQRRLSLKKGWTPWKVTWSKEPKPGGKKKRQCNYATFLVLFVYTIWKTQNIVIFKNIWTPIDITTNILVQKTQEYQSSPMKGKKRIVKHP